MIGFQGQSSHTLGQPGYSDHCASFLPPPGTGVNGQVCQHEIEYIYQAYNQREGGFSQTAFWDHPVVTGVQTTPFKIDIDQGEAILFTVDKLQFLRGNRPSVDAGATTYNLRTEPEGLLGIGDSLVGRNPGSGKLVVDVLTVPSEFIQSTELGVNHQLISLVVKDTTPPCNPFVPLATTAITADEEPAIINVGPHTFTATFDGCPNGQITFDWTFDPSALGMPTTTINDVVGTSTTYSVANGNYTLAVTARPSDTQTTGFLMTRFVNVCTDPPGGGGGLLLREDDGGGTNATAGCGGGGGGGGGEEP